MLEGDKEGFPQRQMSGVRTTKEVIAVFRGGTTGRRTDRSGTLREIVLLLLKRQKVVDPFDRKQASQKAE
jgi:hypothetical protein